MVGKIQETQKRLKDNGYFASEQLAKKVRLFEAEGEKNEKSIPSLYLKGMSGAGKTYLAEVFAKMIGAEEKFVQCFSRMGNENFQLDVNVEGFIKQDADNLIKPGIILQAIEQSYKGPVVLTVDEIDKTRPESDSFLLDFLNKGRLSTGTDIYEKGPYPIYTIITSNDKREIDEALINRSRVVEVPRPSKELFLEILGLPENDPIAYVYNKCPDFSIRQAKKYLGDLEELGVEYDEDALSQYINLDDLEVRSLEDIKRVNKMENGNLEIELPDLARCYIALTSRNEQSWAKFLSSELEKGNKTGFRLYSDEEEQGKFYVDIDTVEQLQMVSEHIEFDDYDNRYRGWFEYTLSDEEMESDNIIWAGNKNKKDGTRFGLKMNGDRMFRIAMNRGTTFVYLDSDSPNTLEQFLGQEKDEIEQEYETDSEYGDDGRDY